MPPGHEGISNDPPLVSGAPLACAAKVENCWVRCVSPQLGHRTSSPPARRTSFSKVVPQSSHLYSKIGMCHSTRLKAILSTQACTSEAEAEKLLTRIENASQP